MYDIEGKGERIELFLGKCGIELLMASGPIDSVGVYPPAEIQQGSIARQALWVFFMHLFDTFRLYL